MWFSRFWVSETVGDATALKNIFSRHEVMHPHLIRCHDRIKKSPLLACTVTTMIVPLVAVYSCVRPSINVGSIGCTLSTIEGVV